MVQKHQLLKDKFLMIENGKKINSSLTASRMNFLSGASRQKDIYVKGTEGIKPLIPVDFRTLEQLAEKN